jgi:hypothetical protein
MSCVIDLADVPPVTTADLSVPMRIAIQHGHGLALYKGLTETQLRAIETDLWAHFSDTPETRLAVALRFRALLAVFATRRLKQIFLTTGFKLIARALTEAATQRMNATIGFSAQKFVLALDHSLSPSQLQPSHARELQIAA